MSNGCVNVEVVQILQKVIAPARNTGTAMATNNTYALGKLRF